MDRQRLRSKLKKKDRQIAVFFLLPSIILLLVFVLWPMIYSIAMSFFDWNPLKDKIFIGLENYRTLFGDKVWWTSFKNTLLYILMNVPAILALSLAMSELVLFISRRSNTLSKLVRSMFFLPCVFSLVATGVAWKYLLGTNYGVVNAMLNQIGLPSVKWLTNGRLALVSVAIVCVWRWSGYYMVMVVAGRLEIPEDYYEAATLEGAGGWQKFRSITLPLLRPVMTYIILMCVVGTFQEFDLVYTMTAGGPGTSTSLTGYYLYKTALSSLKMGYSSTMAVLLFIVSFVFSFFQIKLDKAD